MSQSKCSSRSPIATRGKLRLVFSRSAGPLSRKSSERIGSDSGSSSQYSSEWRSWPERRRPTSGDRAAVGGLPYFFGSAAGTTVECQGFRRFGDSLVDLVTKLIERLFGTAVSQNRAEGSRDIEAVVGATGVIHQELDSGSLIVGDIVDAPIAGDSHAGDGKRMRSSTIFL